MGSILSRKKRFRFLPVLILLFSLIVFSFGAVNPVQAAGFALQNFDSLTSFSTTPSTTAWARNSAGTSPWNVGTEYPYSHSGGKYAYVNHYGDSGDSGWLVDSNVAVLGSPSFYSYKAGYQYKLTFWYATMNGQPQKLRVYWALYQLTAGAMGQIGPEKLVTNQAGSGANNGYLQFTATFTVPSDGTRYIQFRAQGGTYGDYLLIDDVQVTEEPLGTPTPAVCKTNCAPCTVTTSASGLAGTGTTINLSAGQKRTLTAKVATGLGTATISKMTFASSLPTIATVSPASDLTSPYQTTMKGVAAGSTTVTATAYLSDGRTCKSSKTVKVTPCKVANTPLLQNLRIGQTGALITAKVTSGLGTTTINKMSFGSYIPAIAAVTAASDLITPYQTRAKGITEGSTAVWATAYLNDGRTCPSAAARDTDINVTYTTAGQGKAATLETGEAENLCATFPPTNTGEISCKEAAIIALERYPGQLMSIDKTTRYYEFGASPKTQTKEATVWLVGIKPDDQSIFPPAPKDTNEIKFLTTDTIGVAVDRKTKGVLFLEPVFKK